jgi:hypothetical protein
MYRSMMLSYVLNVALDISPAMPSGAASRSPLKGLSRCRSAAWTNRSSVIGLSVVPRDVVYRREAGVAILRAGLYKDHRIQFANGRAHVPTVPASVPRTEAPLSCTDPDVQNFGSLSAPSVGRFRTPKPRFQGAGWQSQPGTLHLHTMAPCPHNSTTLGLVQSPDRISCQQLAHFRPRRREPLEILAREQTKP